MLGMMLAQESQHFRPAFERPVLVVDRQATRAAPHGALIADLHQYQGLDRKISRLKPRRKFDTLTVRYFQITTRSNRIDVCATRTGRRARHDLRQAPPLLRRMLV